MKISRRFLLNQLSKINKGAVLALSWGLCLNSFAQTASLETPKKTDYPGIIETFEKLIQIDHNRFNKKTEQLSKTGKNLSDVSSISNLDFEPDFLNSVILHSDPGYLKMARLSKCRFYDAIITDLLKSSEGKLKNVIVTYVNKDSVRETSVLNKKDFLQKVVSVECPESAKMINEMSIKNLDTTLSKINFDLPTSEDKCRTIHSNWLSDPHTPYLCQINDYVSDADKNMGDPKDLVQRKAVAKVLEQKVKKINLEYLSNICSHLDDEKLFCQEFLNVSFWNKVANNQASSVYAKDFCKAALKVNTLSDAQLRECLARVKKESDLCLYPTSPTALVPQMDCELLSTALNYSSLRSDYNDMPMNSDQLGVTNMGRIILNATKAPVRAYEGPGSTISAAETFIFNDSFDNSEKWQLQACYDNQITNEEICQQTVIGKYGNLRQSYTSVIEDILKRTRGAESKVTCTMLAESEYNPLLLKYKSGCFVIYSPECKISSCPHRILYNDRTISHIRLKSNLAIDYFPLNIPSERTSQSYLLANDFKRGSKSLNNLSGITAFFKKSQKGIIHGVGCAEQLLPSFFQMKSINHCTPLPFIIDGIIKKEEKTVLVTRTAIDSLQAPRLINWSNIFSGVKAYQMLHPMKLWTMYGMD